MLQDLMVPKVVDRRKRASQLRGRFGAESHNWKGDNVSYAAKHMWILNRYGKADHCDNDLSHPGRFEWANISGKYKREVSDYRQLCSSCHRKMDVYKAKTHCPQGHLYSKENTYLNIRGHRCCRICIKIQHKSYLERAHQCQ